MESAEDARDLPTSEQDDVSAQPNRSGARASDVAAELTTEKRQEVRLARRCFTQIERMANLLASYPPGHPVVEESISSTYDAFYEFFEHNDRLSVEVQIHSMEYLGTAERIWETSAPKDYCFALSRDGIFLIHILAGVERGELRRFVEVLTTIVKPDNLHLNTVDLLFEAGMRYVAYEALDESLAALAGLTTDMRDRDTEEEREEIDELFDDAFRKEEDDEDMAGEREYEVRVSDPSLQFKKMEVGSREFLALDEEARSHLEELKLGFLQHNELEHREGEMLSAILGAKPRDRLRRQSIEQIGEVMEALLETPEPWESLDFLKLIHHWRDKFDRSAIRQLKEVVRDAFNTSTIRRLVKQIAKTDKRARRKILQMFNALHLGEASTELVRILGWGIDEEARGDIMRYLRLQAKGGLDFLEEAILDVPAEHLEPLLDLARAGMPRTRGVFLQIVESDKPPPAKVRALEALEGSWEDQSEIREILLPLVEASHSELRRIAASSFAEAAPQHVQRVFEPLLDQRLRKRPEEEVRELVNLYVKHGGKDAVAKLDELVHRRGMVGEDDRELAVTVARALIKTPHPAVIVMLEDVSKDWLVPKRIRSTCGEVVDLLQGS